MNIHLYAAPGYLEKLGPKPCMDDIETADFIGFTDNGIYMDALTKSGLKVDRMNFVISSNNHTVHWELVKRGVGIGAMLDSIGDNEPDVKRVRADLPPIVNPLWLVSHRELKSNRRIRFVFDFLAQELGPLQT